MKFATAVAVASLACMVGAQLDHAMILCGHRLAMARELVCYGEEKVKRGGLHSVLSSIESSEQNGVDGWPWTGRRAALASPHWARLKRGLVDECCMNPCTASQIANYC